MLPVGIKGTPMTRKPLGARYLFPPGSPAREVLLLTPCSRRGNRLGEVMSLPQLTQASLGFSGPLSGVYGLLF